MIFYLFPFSYLLHKTPDPSLLLHFWHPPHVPHDAFPIILPCHEALWWLVG